MKRTMTTSSLNEILSQSCKEHILPLTDRRLHQELLTLLEATDAIIKASVGYSASKYRLTRKRAIEAFKVLKTKGYINKVVGYLKLKNSTAENQLIFNEHIPYLKQICQYFATSLQLSSCDELMSEHLLDNRCDYMSGSFDSVPAIQCEGFPVAANSWHFRVFQKEWPKPSVVKDILNAGFQLVSRTSKSGGSDPRTSFRLLFNDAETILAKSLSQVQRECFKMYYYEVLETDPKVVQTYHLKTVLFWTVGNTSESYWCRKNMAYCCITLLSNLAEALKSNYLAHYFIKGMNLFQHLETRALATAADKVNSTIRNPIGRTGNVTKSIMQHNSDQYYGQDGPGETEKEHSAGVSETFGKVLNNSKERFLKELEILQNYEKHQETRDYFQGKENLDATEVRNILENRCLREVLHFCFDVLFVQRIRGQNIFSTRPHMRYICLGIPVTNKILMDIMTDVLPDQTKDRLIKIRDFMRDWSFLRDPAVLEFIESLTDAPQSTAERDTVELLSGNKVVEFELD